MQKRQSFKQSSGNSENYAPNKLVLKKLPSDTLTMNQIKNQDS